VLPRTKYEIIALGVLGLLFFSIVMLALLSPQG
jgi:hypothetical protein